MYTPRAFFFEHPELLLLYAVTDDTYLNCESLALACVEACKSGVSFLQLRMKHATTQQRVAWYKEIRAMLHDCIPTTAHTIPFVINDDIEAARLADADGVHIGQEDMNCTYAREVLGDDKIIGVSAQTIQEALQAQLQGADYLGVGALLHTATKPDARIVSRETLHAITQSVHIPVVGIGGLNMNTIATLKDSGVKGAAVVSAIFSAPSIADAAEELRREVSRVL